MVQKWTMGVFHGDHSTPKKITMQIIWLNQYCNQNVDSSRNLEVRSKKSKSINLKKVQKLPTTKEARQLRTSFFVKFDCIRFCYPEDLLSELETPWATSKSKRNKMKILPSVGNNQFSWQLWEFGAVELSPKPVKLFFSSPLSF